VPPPHCRFVPPPVPVRPHPYLVPVDVWTRGTTGSFRPQVTAPVAPLICGLCGASTPSVLPPVVLPSSQRFVGDSGNGLGKSFIPIRPPPPRGSPSPVILGSVSKDDFRGVMVKDSPVIVDSIETGIWRGGEDGGESSPLMLLRGEVGGDNPIAWSRWGRFA